MAFSSPKLHLFKLFNSIFNMIELAELCVCVCVCVHAHAFSHVRLFAAPLTVAHQTLLSMDFPGKNTGVGCCFLLQGIFPTQGSNPGVLNCRWILYSLSYQGSPRILEWVAYPFSSRSPRHRNRTGVSCIAGGFFTS